MLVSVLYWSSIQPRKFYKILVLEVSRLSKISLPPWTKTKTVSSTSESLDTSLEHNRKYLVLLSVTIALKVCHDGVLKFCELKKHIVFRINGPGYVGPVYLCLLDTMWPTAMLEY